MVEDLRPTVTGAVPTIWNAVLHHLEDDPDHDMSSLRLVVCGGSAVPVSLMRTFEEKHGVQIRQLWGMTETSPLATMAWPPPGTPEDQHWAYRGTQGQPVCGVQMRIVDDDGRVLPNDGTAVGRWRCAARGSPAPTTWDATTRSSTPAGCAPATWAASTSGASSR